MPRFWKSSSISSLGSRPRRGAEEGSPLPPLFSFLVAVRIGGEKIFWRRPLSSQRLVRVWRGRFRCCFCRFYIVMTPTFTNTAGMPRFATGFVDENGSSQRARLRSGVIKFLFPRSVFIRAELGKLRLPISASCLLADLRNFWPFRLQWAPICVSIIVNTDPI